MLYEKISLVYNKAYKIYLIELGPLLIWLESKKTYIRYNIDYINNAFIAHEVFHERTYPYLNGTTREVKSILQGLDAKRNPLEE